LKSLDAGTILKILVHGSRFSVLGSEFGVQAFRASYMKLNGVIPFGKKRR
jgi:hypothetical protein